MSGLETALKRLQMLVEAVKQVQQQYRDKAGALKSMMGDGKVKKSDLGAAWRNVYQDVKEMKENMKSLEKKLKSKTKDCRSKLDEALKDMKNGGNTGYLALVKQVSQVIKEADRVRKREYLPNNGPSLRNIVIEKEEGEDEGDDDDDEEEEVEKEKKETREERKARRKREKKEKKEREKEKEKGKGRKKSKKRDRKAKKNGGSEEEQLNMLAQSIRF